MVDHQKQVANQRKKHRQMKTINDTLQTEKRKVRVAERSWLRKGRQLGQVVGFFSALGLIWVLASSISAQTLIYNVVVPKKSTFSVVAIDPLTGDVGIAGASCVPISAAGMTALVPGHGASATQAAALDSKQRMQIFDMLQKGATATEIIDFVSDESYDASNGIRQYGVVTLNGGTVHVAGFTGNQTEAWSGDLQNLTMAVSAQGNTLEGPNVVSDALAAFAATDIGSVEFPDRLLRALEAASAAGGDRRCNGNGTRQTAQAAFIAVSKADQPPFAATLGRDPSPNDPDTPWLFISVIEDKGGPNPMLELRKQYNAWRSENLPACDECDLDPIPVPRGGIPRPLSRIALGLVSRLGLGTTAGTICLTSVLIVLAVVIFVFRRRILKRTRQDLPRKGNAGPEP
jgi:uncharacterized Ntn-hydrolase superfamily protein